MTNPRIGQRVRTNVFVGTKKQPMSIGIITEVKDGYCLVDVMGLHGGRPWITAHTYDQLDPIICKSCDCIIDKDECGCNPEGA